MKDELHGKVLSYAIKVIVFSGKLPDTPELQYLKSRLIVCVSEFCENCSEALSLQNSNGWEQRMRTGLHRLNVCVRLLLVIEKKSKNTDKLFAADFASIITEAEELKNTLLGHKGLHTGSGGHIPVC
ncbi:hypothetical protein MNBD_BACTEROID01-91 [hydrothermal vent metagenome]|uniref:Four helix bundle protein n=1 Tax=hydrothermal vent metagenome TaxID=652676 RepID=A0A3B0TMD3_9ZZZZ